MLEIEDFTMEVQDLNIVKDNCSVANFMEYEVAGTASDTGEALAYYLPEDHPTHTGMIGADVLMFHLSWDWLMPVIDKINDMGKSHHFAIFKTYYSMTVEKGGKVYKDFSFAHSEIKYKGKEIEGAYKLVVKFIQWHNQNKTA